MSIRNEMRETCLFVTKKSQKNSLQTRIYVL